MPIFSIKMYLVVAVTLLVSAILYLPGEPRGFLYLRFTRKRFSQKGYFLTIFVTHHRKTEDWRSCTTDSSGSVLF